MFYLLISNFVKLAVGMIRSGSVCEWCKGILRGVHSCDLIFQERYGVLVGGFDFLETTIYDSIYQNKKG